MDSGFGLVVAGMAEAAKVAIVTMNAMKKDLPS